MAVPTGRRQRDNSTGSQSPIGVRCVPCFVHARLLLAQNRPQEARALLATVERRRNLITIHLQQALVCLALGRETQALARVEDALPLAAAGTSPRVPGRTAGDRTSAV